MRKQELIHLHSLLREVARFCGANDTRIEAFERYRDLGTTPMSIHESKARHEAAVTALARAVTTSVLTGADQAELATESP